MSLSMRGGEQPFWDVPPASDQPGRHRVGRTRAVSHRDVFAVREFRVLWAAQVTSYLGDQIAQVAIAVLVYARTGSALLTALTYALTYLPAIAGRPLLAGVADAFPRRRAMIALDLVRAGLLEVMALPGVPLPWVCALLFIAVMLGPPFAAARSSLLGQVLPRDRLALGSAVGNITFQGSQVAGFLMGGLLVATVGAYRSLALDALSFCLSASCIAYWVSPRSLPARGPQAISPLAPPPRGSPSLGLIFGCPPLRSLVLFGWLAGFAVVPEGLAAPYAHMLRGGPVTVGLLMTAMPAGMVAAAAVIGRLARPDEQMRMVGWLAMLSCGPLIACLLRPPLWLLVPLLGVAGAGGAYQFAVARAFVRALPPAHRASAFGTAQSGLLAAQGLGIVLAGAMAERISPPVVVAVAGLLGMTAAAALASEWPRHRAALAARPPAPSAPKG
jgi:MFS family permease